MVEDNKKEKVEKIEEVTTTEVLDEVDKEKEVDRNNLNMQQFMNDMRMVGDQVRDKDLTKPAFHYGDLGVTNYLLWLMLGELMILNDKVNEDEDNE